MKGYCLAIGLNSVDPKHYQGWTGELNACEADASAMASVAKTYQFSTIRTLQTTEATRKRFIEELENAASELQAGDFFLLTYSGHGGNLPDLNNDEEDALDETWCLFDGMMVDDETFKLLAKFKNGVRILCFSDSCHSGTVLKKLYLTRDFEVDRFTSNFPSSERKSKAAPNSVLARVYAENKDFYDSILKDENLSHAADEIQASVMLISGCQDNQLSLDGPFNGAFTSALLKKWNSGRFSGNYKDFHKAIGMLLPPTQSPNLFLIGKNPEKFAAEKIFSL